jgi:phospholipase C
VVSSYAKTNYVDHRLADQTSIISFIEYNWGLGYIDGETVPPNGQGSFDHYACSLLGLFNFSSAPNLRRLILSANGTVADTHFDHQPFR